MSEDPIELGGSPHHIVEQTVLYEGWTRLLRVELQSPDGQVVTREIEDHGEAVAVLAYDEVRRVALLVSLARAPVVRRGEPDLLEAAAGLIDAGEAPDQAVRREALEELGLALGPLEPLGAFWPLPGLSCERVHLYLAPYDPVARVEAGGGLPEEDERLTIHEVDLDALLAGLREGAIRDMKTALLLMFLRDRRPGLFAT